MAERTGPVAALDAGSNSTRLLVVDEDGRTLHREMAITRLGQGVDADGSLSRAAMDRVHAVLERYAATMGALGVTEGLLCATSAVRDAANGAAFLDEAAAILEVPAVCLEGEREAAYAFAGATADLATTAGVVVLDIGGGSTELTTQGPNGLEAVSLQLGCVRNTERYLHGDPPTSAELTALRDGIELALDEGFAHLPSLVGIVPTVVGLAGTVASLVMVDRGLTAYDRSLVHHAEVTAEAVHHWTETLAQLSATERHETYGIEPGRADVLVGGLVVLDAVLARTGARSVLHSEADILDGIAASLLAARSER